MAASATAMGGVFAGAPPTDLWYLCFGPLGLSVASPWVSRTMAEAIVGHSCRIGLAKRLPPLSSHQLLQLLYWSHRVGQVVSPFLIPHA
jgi:hypothetical protein